MLSEKNNEIIKWLEENAAKYADFNYDAGDGGDVIYYTKNLINDLKKFLGKN